MRTALAAAKILYRAGKAAYKSRKSATVTRRSPSRIVVSRQVPRGVYKTVKIEQAVLVGHVFAGSGMAGPHAHNPLYLAYNHAKFSEVSGPYQMWRLKSATLKMTPSKVETTVGGIFYEQLTAGSQVIYGPTLGYVWDTATPYTTVGTSGAIPYSAIVERRNSRVRNFTLGEWNKPVYTTITASGADNDWMNVDFAPTVSPNTGMYWCPVLMTAMVLPAVNASGTFTFTYEWSVTIEVRGSK